MMDANYISERLGSMRQEISDLRITTARYGARTSTRRWRNPLSPYERVVCWRSNGKCRI